MAMESTMVAIPAIRVKILSCLRDSRLSFKRRKKQGVTTSKCLTLEYIFHQQESIYINSSSSNNSSSNNSSNNNSSRGLIWQKLIASSPFFDKSCHR